MSDEDGVVHLVTAFFEFRVILEMLVQRVPQAHQVTLKPL